MALIHAQRGTSQARASGQAHTAIGVQLDIHFAQPIKARRAAGRHDSVGDQERSLQTFGAQRDVQERRRQMKSVDDEAGRQTILGQLLPQIIGMAGQHGIGAVAQDAWIALRRR